VVVVLAYWLVLCWGWCPPVRCHRVGLAYAYSLCWCSSRWAGVRCAVLPWMGWPSCWCGVRWDVLPSRASVAFVRMRWPSLCWCGLHHVGIRGAGLAFVVLAWCSSYWCSCCCVRRAGICAGVVIVAFSCFVLAVSSSWRSLCFVLAVSLSWWCCHAGARAVLSCWHSSCWWRCRAAGVVSWAFIMLAFMLVSSWW
jgi:hypothetical protein